PIATPLSELFMFTIEGNVSKQAKCNLLDWVIRPRLRTIPGVADINALGGEVKSYVIKPDWALLGRYQLSLNDLVLAIESNNKNDGAGRITVGEAALLVRSEGAIHSIDEMKKIVIKSDGGYPMLLEDVAKIEIAAMTRYGFVTKNGQETVEGLVVGLKGANAQKVLDEVRNALDELSGRLPEGVKIVPFYDRSELVNKATTTVAKALLEAVVLVVILLMLFLGDLRAALTVALTLPLAALHTFVMMEYAGMSANLMSLGGLAIAIGMLVDSSVVVVENITTRLTPGMGSHEKLETIYKACSEVAMPVVSGIVIIALVFLPLLTLEGLEGKLFAPVALTIIFALSGSLLLSFTVIPVMTHYLLRGSGSHESWLVAKLSSLYRPVLIWALRHARLVVILTVAAFVSAVGLYFWVGKSFMPTMDEGSIIVGLESLPSISMESSARQVAAIERGLLEIPEIVAVIGRSGSDELGLDPMGLNQTDAFIVTKPIDEWQVADKEWLIEQIRKKLEHYPGIGFGFTQPIEMRISEMLTGVRGDVAIKIFGPDLRQLEAKAVSIAAVLERIPGASDVYYAMNSGMEYRHVIFDRMQLARLGLSQADAQTILRASLEGISAGFVLEEGCRRPIIIRAIDPDETQKIDLGALPLPLPNGESVTLSEVARLETVEGPVKIERENGQRVAVVRCNVDGRDLVGFVNEAKAAVEKEVKLSEGYTLLWGGQFENQQRASERLALVVPVALGLICVILYMTFGSLKQALLILSTVPLALIGGMWGLVLAGEYLSVPASVGFIALLGIAVLNGVVMVSYFNQLAESSLSPHEVIIQGAMRRLRPVLMTASIAAFGLIPLLFASGPGSEIQRPLAAVVIGGLTSSTLLTLILLPILYRRFALDNKASS
ncbi:MAG: CusA/CzcA family heavy metal efflux RND transporter, partial [Campylobacterales bacterium]